VATQLAHASPSVENQMVREFRFIKRKHASHHDAGQGLVGLVGPVGLTAPYPCIPVAAAGHLPPNNHFPQHLFP